MNLIAPQNNASANAIRKIVFFFMLTPWVFVNWCSPSDR
jgi:hypothetical protein